MEISQLQILKSDLSQTRFTRQKLSELKPGDILAEVEIFALTANNVTYGVVGEKMGYWNFFPTDDKDWGIVPVWGVAKVAASEHEDISVGERLYGYWPMGSHLILSPGKISAARLSDTAPHRQELAAVYNNYQRLNNAPGYDASFDHDRVVLFPLYATSFCLYDFFQDNDWFDADQVIISSASSKTAIGTAYAIKEDSNAKRLVGLTSTRNQSAVSALGLYDEVRTYEEIENLNASKPTAIIDMSGNGKIISSLHAHLKDQMKYTSMVGITHYSDNAMGADFIAERSHMFFAPGHMAKRAKDWGPGAFERKAQEFWQRAAITSRSWLTIQTGTGAEIVEHAWREVAKGETPPNSAWAVSL